MTIPWTYLTIDGVQPLDKASRNIRPQWSLIEEGGRLVRLANGERVSLRRRQFNKYKITLSGESVRKPAIDHLAKGDIVELGWPGHLDLDGDVADNDLPRPPVPGSVRRFLRTGEAVEHGTPGIVFTAFRPLLQIMIDDIDVTEDEQNASVSWQLTGEEV